MNIPGGHLRDDRRRMGHRAPVDHRREHCVRGQRLGARVAAVRRRAPLDGCDGDGDLPPRHRRSRPRRLTTGLG